MKPSKYNFFFPFDDEKHLAYNAFSNSMALMDKDTYNKYMEFETNGKRIEDANLVESFQKGGFLIEESIDELEVIRHDMYASRFGNRIMNLTIAVTSDCNFRCVYCYEKNVLSKCYMDKETEENICKFIENNSKLFDYLDVTWYGGEPLMNMVSIERLSAFFINLCKEKKIEYYASVVTNGYNITKETLDVLKKCEVSELQITIDGDAETHNKRRPLQNGKGTFERIVDNLTNLKEEMLPVSLRINTDRENCSMIESVLKELHVRNLTSKVSPYLAKVEKNTYPNEDNACMSMKEFLTYKERFYELMRQYGYNVRNIDNYPTRINSLCGCDRANAYVIGPDGTLYKCWQSIGNKDESIGSINDFQSMRKNTLCYECMLYDPSLDLECRECDYMPICMGGCPKRRVIDKKQVCEQIKYNFERKLKDIAFEIVTLKAKSNL